jgi:ferritin-like metal-binding protein YciE
MSVSLKRVNFVPTAFKQQSSVEPQRFGVHCFPFGNPVPPELLFCAIEKEHRMAKKPKKLEDLFHETLKDIYFAENKILKTLPKMAKAAQSPDLKSAFTQHERETRGQVKRLDRVFKIIGKAARGKTCAAINGITEEGSEIMKDFKGMPALDAGLLAAAQAVEHYEISRYGTLLTWAEELGYDEAVKLLEETLTEEKNTDKILTGIAKSVVNVEAENEAEEE